jgi:hypothetical protein
MERKAMKRKGQVPVSKVPKQMKVADHGYEVFTQEANRSSTPGGSRSRQEKEKKAAGYQGLCLLYL